MKKLLMVICMLVSWMGVSHAQKNKLYTASYSSNFVMADQSYADKVLQLWKDYENNTLDNHADLIADTVTMSIPGAGDIKGKAQNLQGAKQFRATQKDLKIVVDAWMSVKSVDHKDNVVCIWGTEDYTDQSGKHIVRHLQEVWGFNKDGKVDLMLQYARE